MTYEKVSGTLVSDPKLMKRLDLFDDFFNKTRKNFSSEELQKLGNWLVKAKEHQLCLRNVDIFIEDDFAPTFVGERLCSRTPQDGFVEIGCRLTGDRNPKIMEDAFVLRDGHFISEVATECVLHPHCKIVASKLGKGVLAQKGVVAAHSSIGEGSVIQEGANVLGIRIGKFNLVSNLDPMQKQNVSYWLQGTPSMPSTPDNAVVVPHLHESGRIQVKVYIKSHKVMLDILEKSRTSTTFQPFSPKKEGEYKELKPLII